MSLARHLAPLLVAAASAALLQPSLANPASPTASPAPIQGQVLEATPAAGYTYLRLKTASGEVWAAVQAADVRPGARVTIERPMTMENFESKALKRTFDRIVFGQLATPGGTTATGAGAQGGMPALAMPLPGTGSKTAGAATANPHGATAAADAGSRPVARVPRAEGPEGRTVAEVIAGKAKLKDKTVAVRGQVVKVSAGIMGKNWVHLQDGSGSAADGSHDLIVTTQDRPAVGDVVQARGTVRTDVDIGAGYRYAVLVEGATLRR
jgi:hypothetical protein